MRQRYFGVASLHKRLGDQLDILLVSDRTRNKPLAIAEISHRLRFKLERFFNGALAWLAISLNVG